MSLTKCKECGNEVSKKTKSCPKCGAPVKKKPKQYGCGTLILLGIVGFILIVLFPSNDSRNANKSPTSNNTTNTSPSERPTATPIPTDVTYTIIDKNIVPGIKRSLDIRLNKKVSEKVLHSIAMKLKNSDSRTYERTFIGYYLPDMEVNAGYWATTHFNPDLKVRILGLTHEQEQALKQKPKDPSREVIGRWLDESPFTGNRITIFRKDGKLFMENTYKDGSSGIRELLEKKSPLGQRFDKVGGSTAGDLWVLVSNGNLQLRDNVWLIVEAKKIE